MWTYDQLVSECGLGDVAGLCGANCYHDYAPFVKGASTRTYTDEELDAMIEEENTPQEYGGKQYTTYEALQEQRRQERSIRATRQQVKLLETGGASKEELILKRAKYQGQMQGYKAFSDRMGLPMQYGRIRQDGLSGRFSPTQAEKNSVNESHQNTIKIRERRAENSQFAKALTEYNNGAKDTITPRRLLNNLNRTEIGRDTVEYILEHPELNVCLCYNMDHDPELRGRQEDNQILVFASETKTVQATAEVLIHEITHYKYNIGESQWAECVCFAQEEKHRTGKEKLTGSELRNIIKTVHELYPELPWR